MHEPLDPATIPLSKKERLLRQYSEDDFRDKVVRPLLLRRGFKDGRDLCGPTEQGKDAVFVTTNALGTDDVYALQTKRGNLNLASKASESLIAAITQVSTALATPFHFVKTRRAVLPMKVILAVSGKINDAARQHIVSTVKDPRIEFLDADDLVPSIDEFMPEVWFAIDTSTMTYLRKLVASLSDRHHGKSALTIAGPQDPFYCPATAESWVPIRLHKVTVVRKRAHGKVIAVPKFDEIPFTSLHKGREPRVLVLGDAGSGKSTALRRLACIAATDAIASTASGRIPILVRATDIVGRTDVTALFAYLGAETARMSDTHAAAFTIDDLASGRVVLCVDALDEVPQHGARAEVVAALLAASTAYPRMKVILTSRDYTWLADIAGTETFVRYRVSPIEWKQATQIIRRIQSRSPLPESQALELVRRLQQIHGMSLNPLLVTVFASTTDFHRSSIPANITELFKRFTEVMLGRWDSGKGFAQLFHAPLKDFLLQRVALRMHTAKQTSISVEEFDAILAQELVSRGKTSDAPQIREEIVRRSGLFRVLGSTIEFSHLLLQECFAGRGIDTETAIDLIADPWWQRAIVFHFGENPSKAQALMGAIERSRASQGRVRAQCALTVGLAAQACYLATLDVQVRIAGEVLALLAKALDEAFGPGAEKGKRPTIEYVAAYLEYRDAAALECLRTSESEVKRQSESLAPGLDELVEFWQIVGLMECGGLGQALARVRKFNPADRRALLAVHLGALIAAQIRVGQSGDRKLAVEICGRIEPLIGDLRLQVLDELQSELLEWRHGQIEALPDPRDDESPLDGL